MKVVLVTGTRDLADQTLVWRQLDKLQPQLVIHGAARGVDAAADVWALKHHCDIISWAAHWNPGGVYNRQAGSKRNTVLVRIAKRYLDAGHEVICLAMPGPNSVGTHDCGRKAYAAGLRVLRVDVVF